LSRGRRLTEKRATKNIGKIKGKKDAGTREKDEPASKENSVHLEAGKNLCVWDGKDVN